MALLGVMRAVGRRDGPAGVIGHEGGLGLLEAPVVNGTMGHVLDFDDTHLGGVVLHASSPVLAALLAEAGLDSSDEIIEGKRGFCRIYSATAWPEAVLDGLGARWEITRNGYKPYACGVVLHPAIDAVRALRGTAPPEAVGRIELRVHPHAVQITGVQDPRTGLKSKFSLTHSAAVAYADGDAGRAQYTDDRATAPEIVALRERVRVTADASLRRDEARAALVLPAGGRGEAHVPHASGTVDNPMSDAAIEAKFLANAVPVIGATHAEAVVDAVSRLETLPDVGPWRGAGGGGLGLGIGVRRWAAGAVRPARLADGRARLPHGAADPGLRARRRDGARAAAVLVHVAGRSDDPVVAADLGGAAGRRGAHRRRAAAARPAEAGRAREDSRIHRGAGTMIERRALIAAGLTGLAVPAAAQSFRPTRPVEFVVASGPGAGNDVLARALSAVIEGERLAPVRFQVSNRPGGGAATAMNYVQSRRGDPHVIGLFTSVWISSPLVAAEATAMVREMTPIARLVLEPALFVVRDDSPYRSMGELVEAKASPGKLKQSGGSPMARDAMVRQVLMNHTGARWAFVSFPSGGERISALLGGHVDTMLIEPGEAGELIRSGRLRPLAQAAERRMAAFPEVPTLREAGFAVPNVPQARGVLGPPAMPAAAAAYHEDLFRRVTATAAWKRNLEENQLEPAFLDAAATGGFFTEYEAQLREILGDAGVRLAR